jgi:uncharacterized protein
MKQNAKKSTGAGRPGRATAAAKPKPTAPKKTVVPPILMESDAPAVPPVSGPGGRYVLGPTPPARSPQAAPVEPGELPESYGTERLLLTARDPHWLYAHWDLTREQIRKYNAKSVDRHLVLRIFKDAISSEPFREIHVHPESRNWFAHVGLGGTKYLAQLGYYQRNGQWTTIAASDTTFTPPDRMSDDLTVWFETLPPDLRFDHLLKLVKRVISDNVPLVEALQQLRAVGFAGLPEPREIFAQEWTPEQERALADVVKMDATRRVWMGSLEITELIRRQLAQEMWSAAAAQISRPELWSGAITSISSPFGGAERRRGFWFNVNAELIIYGATEPDAKVTIGGRAIKLRPDGTFSYRFALPDGQYELPAVATSAAGDDTRSAALEFRRATEYRGEVGAHPQDPALQPPSPEHVS